MRGEISADGEEAQAKKEAAAEGVEAPHGGRIDAGVRVPALALSRPGQPEAAGVRDHSPAGAAIRAACGTGKEMGRARREEVTRSDNRRWKGVQAEASGLIWPGLRA